GAIGLERDDAFEQQSRLRVVAAIRNDDAQQHDGAGVVWLAANKILADPLRRAEVAAAHQTQGFSNLRLTAAHLPLVACWFCQVQTGGAPAQAARQGGCTSGAPIYDCQSRGAQVR